MVSFSRKTLPDLPVQFKFFYIDEEGDMISISNQDDFEEVLANYNEQTLRLAIATSVEEATSYLEQNNSMLRESIRLN